MAQSNVPKVEAGQELKAQVIEYLENRGYKLTDSATLRGKSGIEHTFELLAQKDDGFIAHTIGIDIAPFGDKEVELNTVFNLANKSYDAGIRDKALIAPKGLSHEVREFSQKQRVRVLDEDFARELLNSEVEQPVKAGDPISFDTKSQLLESLANLGYTVEENVKVKSKSGVEYIFDLVARSGNGLFRQSLAIDIMTGEKEIGLGEVSLFDTRVYDAGINHKAIVVIPSLSAEAKQFAQLQFIKVFEIDKKSAIEFFEPPKEPVAPLQAAPSKPEVKAKLDPQPEALQLIPEVMARRYNAIPLSMSGKILQVAMADPTDIFALEAFSFQSKMRIRPIAASSKEVRDAIDRNYKGYGEIEKQISGISISTAETDDRFAIDAAIDAPLVRALDLIIDEAVKARSSDIHIEPEEGRLRIRYRIDGTLQDMISLPLNTHPALISRVKILADMNIADHHRPQDGQFSTKAKGRLIDVRVATAPTVHGEMSVLRLLDKSLATLEMSELGFLPDSLAKYEALLKVPYGMILVSGPTGAGKTTTLYASINSLDMVGNNIVTIEDPAEYRFKDINQIQVNPQAGITFASGLRSILRLDPDIIMVGEIRDAETANIAIEAALTGHLMPSSIHANDAPGVLFRLLDLNVEPFLVASAVIGIVAQRMVRRVCPDCSHLIEAPLVEQLAYERETGDKKTEFLYGTGCKTCAYTGYLGRTGIFEILTMSDNIRRLISTNASISNVREQALKEGMSTMLNDGMRKVKASITTPTEVLRAAYSPI